MDYIQQLKGIFIEPFKTLKTLKKEKGLKKPFKFFIISSLVIGIISLIFETTTKNPLLEGTPLPVLIVFSLLGIVFIYTTIIFALSGFCHLMVKAFGGKKPFYETFKPFANIFIGFWIIAELIGRFSIYVPALAVVGIIVLIWGIVLLIKALKMYTGLDNGKLAGVVIITGLVFLTIGYFVMKAALPIIGQQI